MAASELSETDDLARWPLRLRIFLFFALLGLGGAAAIAAAAVFGYSRLDPAAPVSAFVLTAMTAGFALLGLTVWIWLLFDENVAKPVLRLASDLRARAHADVAEGVRAAEARYLGDLAPAAAAVTRGLSESRSELAAAVAREQARIIAERARLEAVLRDAPAGCLLLSADYRIALYNIQALDQLGAIGALGLGRSVFELFAREPILDAAARLERRNEAAATDLLCLSRDGGKVFQARMRRLSETGEADESTSFVLTLRDVTAELEEHAAREGLLRELFDRVRRPAATLTASIAALRTPEGAEPEQRARLQAGMVEETRDLAAAVTELGDRYEAGGARWWPQSDAPAGDVLRSTQARLAVEGAPIEIEAAAAMTLRCDGFAISRLFGDLASRIVARGEATELRLTAAPQPETSEAAIDLSWRGAPAAMGALEAWLDAPLSGGFSGFTLRDTLRAHGADIWPQTFPPDRVGLRAPLLLSPEQPEHRERAVYLDLDVLSAREADKLLSTSFVVFDTETTGLAPAEGDEIIQLAAVRVVNNRVLADDRFDMLVNPGRSIPPRSTEIHGLTDDMVADAPKLDVVGRRFHAFCGDATLVAHNAAFDLAFLKRAESRIGAVFDHRVMDTVLLSTVLFGRSANHSLDALAERLGVEIPAEARHTAIGDALATAEVAVKMLAMLEGHGVNSWRELEEASAPFQDFVARGSLVATA